MQKMILLLSSTLIVSLIVILWWTSHPIYSEEYKYDIIIFNRKAHSRAKTDRPPVIFTHLEHSQRDECNVCHPNIFIKKKGANSINMQQNAEGKYCGYCHNGKRSWSLLYCDICHSGNSTSDESPLFRK